MLVEEVRASNVLASVCGGIQHMGMCSFWVHCTHCVGYLESLGWDIGWSGVENNGCS